MQEIVRQYDSVLIAKYMLSLAYEKRIALNITKVQKMLYMAYGYFLSKGRQISTEAPKAWPYGPVFPRTRKNVDYQNILTLDNEIFDEIKVDNELTDKLNDIIAKYAGFTATELSDWSHMDGGPWDRTTKQDGFKWGITAIPDEFIKEYFDELNV